MNRNEKRLRMVIYPFTLGMITTTILLLIFAWEGWSACPPWLVLIGVTVIPAIAVCTMVVVTVRFHELWTAQKGIFIIIKEDDQ